MHDMSVNKMQVRFCSKLKKIYVSATSDLFGKEEFK